MRNAMLQPTPKRKTEEDILELSIPLFAQRGYDGVSMRDIASAAGLTPAALYYHFPDKDHLYLNAVAKEFAEKAAPLKCALEGPGDAWARLEAFVTETAQLLAAEKDFLRLMQWVQIDNDDTRNRKLAEHVFEPLFTSVYELAGELGPNHDAYMLTISIFSLIVFPFQKGEGRQLMPGYHPDKDKPEVLSRHVIGLLRAMQSQADSNE